MSSLFFRSDGFTDIMANGLQHHTMQCCAAHDLRIENERNI
jgi:hypothetical protein